MAESQEPDKPKYPDLESRRSRDVSYGEEDERAARERGRRGQDNRAFYLIEREAIQLRRLRWDVSDDGKRALQEIEDLATSLQRTRRRVSRSVALRPIEGLAQYARPFERRETRSPTFVARVRSWFSSAGERRDKRRSKA